ncbi:MAG: hypothetical protein ACREEM_56370, partial [Blastocatellia bacterium]
MALVSPNNGVKRISGRTEVATRPLMPLIPLQRKLDYAAPAMGIALSTSLLRGQFLVLMPIVDSDLVVFSGHFDRTLPLRFTASLDHSG